MKVWYHDGATLFLTPIFATWREVSCWLSEAGHEARRAMNEAGADHAIYGTRSYDPESGALTEVNIYAPPVLLDEEEFERRVAAHLAEHPGDLILAHHKF